MATNSKEYWEKRETENIERNKNAEAEIEKRTQEILQSTYDRIQKEINGFYGKYARSEGITMAEAKKRISKLDIAEYERKAKRYVEEHNFTQKANEEMRLYNATMKINRLELLKSNIGLELAQGYSELENLYAESLDERAREEFKRQAGILGKGVENPKGAAHEIATASFRNATFSDRIWANQSMLKSELDSLLREGLIQGKNPRVLARHIEKRFGVEKYKAERLMRTEMARVQIAAQQASYLKNGYDSYMYIAEPSACTICKAMSGEVFLVSGMQTGSNAPPMHPNCRCSTAAYMDRSEHERLLNEKDVEKMSTNDTIKSGARITKPESKEGQAFANSFYPEIRKRTTDIEKISKNLGKPEKEIEQIKNYLFIDKSLYDEELQMWRRFDPDCAIAQSWQRLTDGKNIKKHDRTLIAHELYEMQLKIENPSMTHEEAHKHAQAKFNYRKGADEYYGNLDKSKK